MEIIEELGRQVRAAGARLLVADLVLYFNPQAGDASRALSAACARNHFGYVQPAIELQKSVRGGVPTAWAHDRHFNAVGNEIVASSLERWLRGSRIPRRARDD